MKAEPKFKQKKTKHSGKRNLQILKHDNKTKNIKGMFKTKSATNKKKRNVSDELDLENVPCLWDQYRPDECNIDAGPGRQM